MKDLHFELQFRQDAAFFAERALGLELDDLQREVLDHTIDYGIVNCCRQYGKTFMLALKAVHQMVFWPDSTVLVVAPTQRQAGELIRRVYSFLAKLGWKCKSDGVTRPSLALENGSRILGLPSRADTIRGYSPQLVIVDEAAFCPDEVEAALRPMMLNRRTRRALWLISTPNGRRGMFYDTWSQKTDLRWRKFSRTAVECAWIREEDLRAERERLGEEKFAQEYLCEFLESRRALVRGDQIVRAFDAELVPLEQDQRWFLGQDAPRHTYVGLDLGQARDRSALVVLEYWFRYTGRRDPVTWEPVRELDCRVRKVKQFDLGLSYVEVAREVVRVFEHHIFTYGATLVVDATGVGAAVVDLLRQALRSSRVMLCPVVLTGGSRVVLAGSTYSVPKWEVFEAVRHLLESGGLRLAARAPGMEGLRQELERLERRPRASGVDEVSGKRTGNDDLAMALALAAWRMMWKHRGEVNRELLRAA